MENPRPIDTKHRLYDNLNGIKMDTIYGIFGAGGFAREVMPLVRDQTSGNSELVFVVTGDFPVPNKPIDGHDVIHIEEFLGYDAKERYFNIAIADSIARKNLSDLPLHLAKPFSIAARNAVFLDSSSIGEGSIFCNFTHVTQGAKIGKFFHCNIYSYVAHDCVIGDYVTFGPGVKCNGHVRIEDHAYIGAGAIIKDGTHKPIVIGKGAVVGMGAVVTKSVPPGVTVVGNPARILEKVNSTHSK